MQRYRISYTLKVVHRFLCLTVVDDVTFHHEHDVIEFHEDFGGGLMDCGDDCAALFC